MTQNQTIKQDEGKPRLSLVPMQILTDIAQVREYGTVKYPAESWREVSLQRYLDALLRHIAAMSDNGIASKDAESGIEHYKHAACNISFICALAADKSEV